VGLEAIVNLSGSILKLGATPHAWGFAQREGALWAPDKERMTKSGALNDPKHS